MRKDFYLNCDQLDQLPEINKQNWLFELDWLVKFLVQGATVLQVGCMDGVRIIELLKKRPDLNVTGLDIEPDFIKIAKENFQKTGVNANLIEADITIFKPDSLFDYVICLNNTLGYIPETLKAVEAIKSAGKSSIISVYGEQFTDTVAQNYFTSIGLELEKIENNILYLKDFGAVKRFTKSEVESWSGEYIESPLGYIWGTW